MKVEFNQGVPEGCVEWLWANVGPGNLRRKLSTAMPWRPREETDAWFYERVEIEIPSNDPAQDSNTRYVPTITVKDEKLAMMFMLRWS